MSEGAPQTPVPAAPENPILLLEMSPVVAYHIYVALCKHHASLGILANYRITHADSLRAYNELGPVIANIEQQLAEYHQSQIKPETNR